MRAGPFLLLLPVALMTACGPNHIAPFTPRDRQYNAGKYAATEADAKPTVGSLYSEGRAGLLEDTRAVRTGDIVVIKIDEQANAKGDATTKLSKSTDRSAKVDALLGLVPAIKAAHPNIDPAQLIALAASTNFNGDGQTARNGALTGNISVRVKQQLPNGDLFVEGTKVVMINHEEYHLYISGLVRIADIGRDNTVVSSRVADAQVEFTGRGDVAETIDRGWLSKLLDAVNPF